MNNTRSFPTYSVLRGHPPPVSNSYKVIRRVVQVTGDGTTGLTVGKLSAALTGPSGDFLVCQVDCYSTATATASSPSDTFTLKTGNILPEETNNTLEDVVVTDYGTASSLPGTRFHLPKTRSKWFNKDTASTLALCTSTKACVFVVHVLQQLNA